MRYILILILAVGLFGRAASAAENLDQAVQSLAQQILDQYPTDAPSMRIAVTAFLASDRKTTQFTNFLLTALTGEMVAQSGGKFRVIERQQLEAALSEIEMQNVPIFAGDSARDLGKFLGVDALMIGNITPLTDTVRLNARLIKVDTVETIAQARDWIPRIPTIDKQLAAEVRLTRVRVGGGNEPDPRAGIWKGTVSCGDVSFGLALSMVVDPDDGVSAMYAHFPTGEGVVGVHEMEGTFNAAESLITLSPRSVLYSPGRRGALGIQGRMDVDQGMFEGAYIDSTACDTFTLRRIQR